MSFNNIWSPELCMILIDEYKENLILWDSQHKFYYNKDKKQEAWEDIANNLNINVEKVKSKMNSLLAAFRRERTKFRKAHPERPYISQWYAFKALHFLLNEDDINKLEIIQNFENCKNNPSPIQPENSFIESLKDPLNILDEIEEPVEITEHSDNKKYKMNEIENIDSNHFIYENHEQNYTIIPNDENLSTWKEECNAYGQYIANKLCQYDLRTRAFAEHAMSNIIFEADIGKFRNDTSSSSDNLYLCGDFEHTWLKRSNMNTN